MDTGRAQNSCYPRPRSPPVSPPRRRSEPLRPSAKVASKEESNPRIGKATSGNVKTVPLLAAERLAITGLPKPLGGRGPRNLPQSTQYIGICEEPWMTKRIIYNMAFSDDGKVSGTCSSGNDRSFMVSGQYDAAKGLYRWAEMSDGSTAYKSVLADPSPYIQSLTKSCSVHVEVEIKIHKDMQLEGQYVTTTGSSGNLTLRAI